VTTAGAMKCWGGNDSGQLGRGTIEAGVVSPVAVAAMSSGVIGISAKAAQTCALVHRGLGALLGR
jgi:hypothetical protein